MFITVIGFIGLSLNANALKYISINNKECKAKPVIMNINSNEPLFYPYSVIVNQCNGSCNDINNPMLNCAFLMLLKTLISKYLI